MTFDPLGEVRSDLCEQHGLSLQEPHVCPFAAGINDDNTTLCNCCPECEGNCADDI